MRLGSWLLLGLVASLSASCGSKTGLKVVECDPDAGPCCTPVAETCNGLDDDCDGAADDGIACFFLDGRSIAPVPNNRCGAGWYRYDFPDSESANPSPDIRRSGEVVVAVQAGAECDGRASGSDCGLASRWLRRSARGGFHHHSSERWWPRRRRRARRVHARFRVGDRPLRLGVAAVLH